jgi:hypothetical protein
MPATIQIRDVPEMLHRKLKARAALAGKSLSDYLLAEIGGTFSISKSLKFSAATPPVDRYPLGEAERRSTTLARCA